MTYLDEMYDYLTRPENYQSALELAENVKVINKRLEEEFWKIVTDELKLKVENYPYNRDRLVFKREGWFKITKEGWDYYYIAGKFQTIGMSRKDEMFRIEGEKEIIKTVLQEENYRWNIGQGQDLGWICGRIFIRTFETGDQMMKILPAKRRGEINSAVDEYLSYIGRLIPICDKINEKLGESVNQA